MGTCWDEPGLLTLLLGIFLIVGGLVSFIPQYHAIVSRKSSRGLSFVTLGLGLSSSAFSACNVGMLNWWRIQCCWQQPRGTLECAGNNLAFAQLFTGFLWNLIQFILFIHFCRPEGEHFRPTDAERTKKFATITLISIITVVSTVASVAAVLYYVYDVYSWRLKIYATVLGYFSAVLNGSQYFPQLYITAKLRGAHPNPHYSLRSPHNKPAATWSDRSRRSICGVHVHPGWGPGPYLHLPTP